MLSLSFDDIPVSAATAGAAALEARGLRGTFYVSAGLAGGDGPLGEYAGEAVVRGLHHRGHEIGCHTFSHSDCGQASAIAIRSEVELNTRTLAQWGIRPPSTFAYPYGDVSHQTKPILANRYKLLRAVHAGVIRQGSDLAQAPAVGIEGASGEATARRWLLRAHASEAWLILFTHDVRPVPSPWGATPDALGRLLDEALSLGFDVVTASEGAEKLGAEP